MERPLEGGGGGAEQETVGVEEGADAAERDADGHRDHNAGPAGEGLPASAAAAEHEGSMPAGHPADLAGGRGKTEEIGRRGGRGAAGRGGGGLEFFPFRFLGRGNLGRSVEM